MAGKPANPSGLPQSERLGHTGQHRASPTPGPSESQTKVNAAPVGSASPTLLGEAGLGPSTPGAQALDIGGFPCPPMLGSGHVRPSPRTWRSSHGVPVPPWGALRLLSFPAGGPRAREGNSGCREDRSREGAQGPAGGLIWRGQRHASPARPSCGGLPTAAIGFTVGRVQKTDATPEHEADTGWGEAGISIPNEPLLSRGR